MTTKMTYLLFQWPNWDYEYLQKALGPDCKVLFSNNHKQRVLRYLSGSIPAVRESKRDDVLVCWYDAQAVMCWWICSLFFLRRKIVCLNILLKQKPTVKNRIVSFLYKKALQAPNFKATVTSRYYGEWLNHQLGIDVKYTLLHDVYHDYYEKPQFAESKDDVVFCGGCYGRDWPLMMEIVKAMPNVKFYLVMMKDMERRFYHEMDGKYPENVQVMTNIPYRSFMKCLCQSKIVCMPLDCEAPQGLIVMYEAAANNKLILTSDSPTTQEYFDENQRLGKDVSQWCDAIRYYLLHDDERKNKALDFKNFIKRECNESAYANIVEKMVKG